MRIGLIIRPREGMEGLERLREAISELRDRGHQVRPRLTFERGDAARFARRAGRAGADMVLSAGGDGTLNEVVNGLMGVDWTGRVGIVPMGTANDFAAGLGIPGDPSEAVRVALEGRKVAVDVPRVNRRYFVNVSTGGFGAVATEETPSETKKLLGPWAYVITGVKKFAELRPSMARFETPAGLAYEGEMMLFAVGNAKRTGGGTMLTPRAEFGDGQLDVLVVPAMPRMDFLSLLPDLRAGTHVDHPGVHYFRTERLVVESDETLSVNADGEALRGRRFEYVLSGRTISLMVP